MSRLSSQAAHRAGAQVSILWILIPLALAGAIELAQAWHGPCVLALSASHGINAGDLPAFLLVVVAMAAGRARSSGRASLTRGWVLPASAITLGAALLTAGMLATAGGALMPAGGATLDGTIRQRIADDAVPVNRWTNVALTYDGSRQWLYINGRAVAGHSASGRIQTPRKPLWIGGNRPYGEHFDGLIDEVRIYDRALSVRAIRRDMAAPIRRVPGLVAAYAFDTGAGTQAQDASGHGNTGDITSGTWARGRYGDALRFNGVDSVVRVPPSRWLDLTRAMTLSAWIRPSEEQTGWRTVVQREVDAYFLTASSGRHDRLGLEDTVRIALVVVAAVWFCWLISSDRGPRTTARRRSWWLPALLFMLGAAGDAALAPSGTLLGCTLVALWLAATASGSGERAGFLLAAAACAGVTIAALASAGDVGSVLAHDQGATARTTALGALFVLAGTLAARRSSRDAHFATSRFSASPGRVFRRDSHV